MKTIINLYIATPKSRVLFSLLFFACLLNVGCDDFLEVDDPTGQVSHDMVFDAEETATAAVTTLYSKLRDQVVLTGRLEGVSHLLALYADEIDSYSIDHSEPTYAFYNHTILASNTVIKSVWDSSYNLIYMTNSVIEGIEASQSLSPAVKNQLKGEALFIRALVHFYLVNLFGDIPYVTTTDYLVNLDLSRMPIAAVYDRIIIDLSEAKTMLADEYISGERIRVNSYVASALLARVYLYNQRWQEAESESSILINASSLYHLEMDMNNEFLKESASAILQLKPRNPGDNTLEAQTFVFTSGPPPTAALNPGFIDGFETGDQRRYIWVNEVTDGTVTWYMPYKYKQWENTGASMEYSIVLRLAEQYLIRAEARMQSGNLLGARQDINTIRNRAGLPDTEATFSAEIMQAIVKERKFELFTEHGHRWFDMKRLELAAEVLAPLKPNWRPTDILLPIPETELLMNPNLAPQNPGY